MSDETPVMRSLYIPAKLDNVLRQMASQRGVRISDVVAEFIELGIETVKASPTHSMAEKMANNQARLAFREKKIAELVTQIDREFDERWQKVKAAVASVYEDEQNG